MQEKESLPFDVEAERVQLVYTPGSCCHVHRSAGNTNKLQAAHLYRASAYSEITAPKLEWLRGYTASFHKTESKTNFVSCLVPSETQGFS